MKKQYLLCILALILVVTMLTGCTQNQTRKDYSSSTAATSQKKDAGARLESYLKTASPDTSTATDNIGAKLEQTISNSARLKVKECNDTSVLVEITAPDIPALVAKIRANGGGAEEFWRHWKVVNIPLLLRNSPWKLMKMVTQWTLGPLLMPCTAGF